MKRAPALLGLSRDHHSGLVLARRAIKASRCDKDTAQAEWQSIIEIFRQDLEPHFIVEEETLLPALLAIGESALVERTLGEHDRLRALVLDTSAQSLAPFGDHLREHIRFEEQILFETAQKRLNAKALAMIAELHATTSF